MGKSHMAPFGIFYGSEKTLGAKKGVFPFGAQGSLVRVYSRGYDTKKGAKKSLIGVGVWFGKECLHLRSGLLTLFAGFIFAFWFSSKKVSLGFPKWALVVLN